MDRTYFLYKHINSHTNEVFYVGKGTFYPNRKTFKGKHSRAFDTKRNSYWHRIVNKYSYTIKIIGYYTSEEEVYLNEHRIISLYKSKGQCYTNLNDGGEGGHNPSLQTRLKLKKAQSGRQYSKKDKLKLSGKNNSNWAGYCNTPEGIFENSSIAAKALGVSKMTISRRCNNPKISNWFLSKF